MSSFIERAYGWAADRMDSADFIELYFVLSDLVDIDLTDAELAETSSFDAMASSTVTKQRNDDRPVGKQVF